MMTGAWIRVSRNRRCPVCDHADWCLISEDGSAAICPRVESAERVGEAGWLHRLRDSTAWEARPRHIVLEPRPAFAEISKLAARYHEVAARGGWLDKLSEELGLSVESLRQFRVGWCSQERCSTWPLYDDSGRIVGINRRFRDGSKKVVFGHRAGLYLADDMPVALSSLPLLVCEGGTDAAAGRDMGLVSVGRFSCTHGARLLTGLVRRRRPDLLVIVADADGPGRRGAESLASVLLPYVAHLRIIQPPAAHKDLRTWKRAGASGDDVRRLTESAPPRRLAVKVRQV